MSWLQRLALRSSGVLAVLFLWELSTRVGWLDSTFLPPPSKVVATIGTMAVKGAIVTHVLLSGFRAVVGFALALLIGVPLGIALGYNWPFACAVAAPFLRVLSQVNPFSLMPVFLLVFGSGELVKVTTVGWAALWPVVFYTVTAARNLDPGLVKAGRAMAAPPAVLIAKVVVPAALPTVFVGVRVASTLVFFMLVGAEMLGTTGGLGWLVHSSAMNYQIPGIYAGALVVIVLGYALHSLLVDIESRLALWQGNETTASGSPGPRPLGRMRLYSLCAAMALLVVGGVLEMGRLRRHDLAGTVTPGLEAGP